MKPVLDALDIVLSGIEPLGVEPVPLGSLPGRIAARDHVAKISQPPFSASAMDGFAVTAEDAVSGRSLEVIGEAPAGAPFQGRVGQGEAVRVFTGAVIPDGAGHVVIQEDVERVDDQITITDEQTGGRHIRAAGIDFTVGDVLAKSGERFGRFHGALLAAANVAEAECYRRPRVALFSSGDELRAPGNDLAPGEIINSNHYAVSEIVRAAGGVPDYLGCAGDDIAEIEAMYKQAASADVVLPIGGASVGDYDYMREGFTAAGGELIFEKVAMKPGKPTWCGALGSARVIGLPGNPAAAIVASSIFAQPLIARLAGDTSHATFMQAVTASGLPANGPRESYLRAERIGAEGGRVVVQPFRSQDSSLLSAFAKCDVLIRRVPNAPAVEAGDAVEVRFIADLLQGVG